MVAVGAGTIAVAAGAEPQPANLAARMTRMAGMCGCRNMVVAFGFRLTALLKEGLQCLQLGNRRLAGKVTAYVGGGLPIQQLTIL